MKRIAQMVLVFAFAGVVGVVAVPSVAGALGDPCAHCAECAGPGCNCWGFEDCGVKTGNCYYDPNLECESCEPC